MNLETERVREVFLEITDKEYSEGGIVSFRQVIPNIDLADEENFPDQRLAQTIKIMMREVDEKVAGKLRYHGNRFLFPKYYVDVGQEPEIRAQAVYLVAVIYDIYDPLDKKVIPDLAFNSGRIVGWECPSCETMERITRKKCWGCGTERAIILGEDTNGNLYHRG